MESNSEEAGIDLEEETQIHHFLRSDDAELTDIISGIPAERGKRGQEQEEKTLCRAHQQEEGRLHREHQEEKLRREHHAEEERLRREQHEKEESLRKEQHAEEERYRREQLEEELRREQQEERLRREQQEEKLRREQHEKEESLRKEQHAEEERYRREQLEEELRREQQEERLRWEQQEEKLRREQHEKERLRREQQEEKLRREQHEKERLCREQQEEKLSREQHEKERLRREQQEEKLRREQHEKERLRREQQEEKLRREQHEKERLHREQQEEKLRREQQEEKLRREQHEKERLRWEQQEEKLSREQHEEEERLSKKHQEEKLGREQHEKERLRREKQDEKLSREQHEEEEKRRREQHEAEKLCRERQQGARHHRDEEHKRHHPENQDIDEREGTSQTLPILPPAFGYSVPPLSPSRPKSPWGKLDPYDSSEEGKEYVGFATLPNQVHRKYVKKGFEFTLMVAGESGLGKSTLINSLFLTDLYRDRQLPSPEESVTQTIEIVKQTVDIEEKGVRLRLTVVDTPGYGDAINNVDCWKPVADYIDQQFEQYFRDESGLNRRNLQDTRVHCCLYFLSPLGHGMRPLDIEFLRALHDRVNIVPILGKADSLTPKELLQKKQRIRDELDHFGIRVYQFPDCDTDQDEEFKLQDLELKRSIPFAVIGSNTVVEINGRRVRGRLYPWGIVDVENPEHCDFVKLRTMLIRTHMQDLKDVTREIPYENYRAQCIQSLTQRVVKERNRNKLTRESGTDFPIPSGPSSPDHEKQIREKDEKLRHTKEQLEKMQRLIKDSH
ncbi:septin-4 isoform X2 [Ascaphus truei]|uniref:septin-4 isoform X2 n=1 Tax=Ascaphus truei TaxID=8439 RepID=UPI003F5961B8